MGVVFDPCRPYNFSTGLAAKSAPVVESAPIEIAAHVFLDVEQAVSVLYFSPTRSSKF